MDWNVAPKTTVYGRLQWGYEKRAGGVSFLGSARRLAAACRASTRSTRSATSTRCCTPSTTTTFAEFTVGVNWAHQYTSAVRPGGAGLNDRTHRAARASSSSSRPRIPDNLLPQATFTGGACRATIGVVQHRAAGWPFFGYNTLFNVSGNLTKLKGAHNMKTGHLRRAHDAPGAAASAFNGIAQLQHRRLEPAQHERRLRQRAARRGHAVPGVERPPVGARPVHEHRVLRAGQLAREAELHHRRRRPLLLHHADAERGRQGRGSSSPSSGTPAQAPLLYQPVDSSTGRAWRRIR